MDLRATLERLGEPEAHESLSEHWEDSLATQPETIPFLEPLALREWIDWCGLDPSAAEQIEEAARRIAGDADLRAIAWHCWRRLYVHTETWGFDRWPTLRGQLGELAGCFPLILGLSMVPLTRETHAALGVSEETTRQTCREVACFANNHYDWTEGRFWGLIVGQLFWLRHYPAGRLFRLGRFEHMLQPFRGGVVVYRERESGDVVALAEAGGSYNREGYVPYEDQPDPEGFTTTLEERPEAVVGHPVDPAGTVCRQRARLDLARWERVLAKGDWVLDMHIPSGGKMDPETCAQSLSEALAFFDATFPDHRARGFQCVSWIYNPQLPEMLGAEANLVRHLREVYLNPCGSSGRDGLFFLFYTDEVDPATARRDTSIRRAFLEWLASGRRLRSSAMFLLREDLAHYGRDGYRAAWPPVDLEWEAM